MNRNQRFLSLSFFTTFLAISNLYSSQANSLSMSSSSIGSSSSSAPARVSGSTVNSGENQIRTNHEIEAAKGFFNLAKAWQLGFINLPKPYQIDNATNPYMGKNEKLAAIFFQLAANLGNARALYELGTCYRVGNGVEKNLEKSEECFKMATAKGYRALAEQEVLLTVRKTRESAAIIQKDSFLLGKKYSAGRDVEKDEKVALMLYIVAAFAGRNVGLNGSLAEFEIGRCWESGIGVTADPEVAAIFYRYAADHGHAQARCKLGAYYEKGIGTGWFAVDLTRAFENYSLAAEQGCADAQYHLGLCHAKGVGVNVVNQVQAVRFYTQAVEQRHAKAQYELGVCFQNGVGVPAADPVRAAELFLLSANQGERDAQYRIAQCYENGEGIDANPAKTFEYYQLAANQEHEEAKKKVAELGAAEKTYESITAKEVYELGEAHEKGENIAKDAKLAAQLYEVAAKNGYGPAEYKFGYCYEHGIGIAVDLKKAFEFYEVAAKRGEALAQFRLGLFYELGKGFWFSYSYPAKAVEWYTKAAAQGNASALYHLGTCYEVGRAVTKNLSRGLIYFKLAAKCKQQEAQKDDATSIANAQKKVAEATEDMKKFLNLTPQELCILAETFHTGTNTVKDLEMAKELYEVAAKRGNPTACKKCKALDAEIKLVNEREIKAKKAADTQQYQASVIVQAAATSVPTHHEQQTVSSNSSSSSSSVQSGTGKERQRNLSAVEELPPEERKKEAAEREDSAVLGASGMSSSSSQQETKEKAAKEAASTPYPMAFTESLDKKLQASVLEDCPKKIRRLIDLWNDYNMAWKMKDEKLRKELSEELPRNVILVGPPGTGKTTMGKAIAGECDMPYFMHIAASFSNDYKSSGLLNLRRFFEDSVSLGEPCVLIIDELGALFQQHANKNDSDGNILMLFWQLLDQYKNSPLLVIATLNDISEAPEQIASRFHDHTVEIPLPDEKKRVKLISYYMERLCRTSNEALAKEFAALTDGYSNRALEAFVRIAKLEHRTRHVQTLLPSRDDFSQALAELKEADKKYKKKSSIDSRVIDYGFQAVNLAHGVTNTCLGRKYHKEALKAQESTFWSKAGHVASLALQAVSVVVAAKAGRGTPS